MFRFIFYDLLSLLTLVEKVRAFMDILDKQKLCKAAVSGVCFARNWSQEQLFTNSKARNIVMLTCSYNVSIACQPMLLSNKLYQDVILSAMTTFY